MRYSRFIAFQQFVRVRSGKMWGLLGLVILALIVLAPPFDFPNEVLITIPEGATVADIGTLLEAQHLIRSGEVFRVMARLIGSSETLQAGDYLFTDPISVTAVLFRLESGDFRLEPIRVRLPEGATRHQMAVLLDVALPRFETNTFLAITKEAEGYLFPDTYFFLPTATAEDVVSLLQETFEEKIASFASDLERSPYTRHEIVTMASLIEREAHDPDDRRLIASVLWNRLEIDMPLQVDAALFFLLGKPSSELTRDDLALDSPYNTYVYRGLPPGPIGNPSSDAIAAALRPTPSEYFYYLSDADGVTYFARDFEEHKENKERYLLN